MGELVSAVQRAWLAVVVGTALGCASTGGSAVALDQPARVEVLADPQPHATASVAVVFDDGHGSRGRVDVWASAGAIHGLAQIDQGSVRWRVRRGADGRLAGERWSVARRRDPDGLARLEHARARVVALAELDPFDPLDPRDHCARAEQWALAELALELGVRAWSGVGRARLPSLAALTERALADCPD